MSGSIGAESGLSANEALKLGSDFLRGKLAEELADGTTGGISDESNQLGKFHGMYIQDNRDLRNQLKKEGKEKAYGFMVRVRLPGGVATPGQWLALDGLADQVGAGSLRLTTRQTFQFHGVVKSDVKKLVKGMQSVLLDSIAACGDVNRNVMAPPNPERSAILRQVYDEARDWSQYALPKSRAYYEIFLDEERVAGGEETMYGATYLARKFKVGFAVPPSNDVDIFSQDLGFIAIVEGGQLLGYNVTAGGGQGMSHGNVETYPRLADVIGFIPAGKVRAVAEATLTTARDFCDRTNRKHARLKYQLEERGVEWFRSEVESRSGVVFEPARPFRFETIEDPLGWQRCEDGTWFFGLHILSGRIRDTENVRLKSALREVAEIHTGDFRLTPSQNLTISGVEESGKPRIEAILSRHGVAISRVESGLRRNALSCVALPTCGLALAEAERALPGILEKLELVLAGVGLRNDAISLRVTGCPNGCARPYLAEIAFVGKAPNKYALYLGGDYVGSRLGKLFAASVTVDEAMAHLTSIIKTYASDRLAGERFGDYCNRVVLPPDATYHSTGTHLEHGK